MQGCRRHGRVDAQRGSLHIAALSMKHSPTAASLIYMNPDFLFTKPAGSKILKGKMFVEAISNPPQADWFRIKAEKHRGGAEFQPADILKYFEDFKRGPYPASGGMGQKTFLR
ncbi:MAG: hypothetical protein JRF72_06885 [Deltaproteobacteria bacterium]|jgi:hypothetical protein|nr:hypothetical protein [Deltaproteobacteria bacterium]